MGRIISYTYDSNDCWTPARVQLLRSSGATNFVVSKQPIPWPDLCSSKFMLLWIYPRDSLFVINSPLAWEFSSFWKRYRLTSCLHVNCEMMVFELAITNNTASKYNKFRSDQTVSYIQSYLIKLKHLRLGASLRSGLRKFLGRRVLIDDYNILLVSVKRRRRYQVPGNGKI